MKGIPSFCNCRRPNSLSAVAPVEVRRRSSPPGLPGLAEPQLRPPHAEGFIELVGPDGYLAASAPEVKWEALGSYLGRLDAPR